MANRDVARDILAYVLTGELDGSAFDLNEEQVERMAHIIHQLAEGRLMAVTELPPLSKMPPIDPNLKPFRGDPNMN